MAGTCGRGVSALVLGSSHMNNASGRAAASQQHCLGLLKVLRSGRCASSCRKNSAGLRSPNAVSNKSSTAYERFMQNTCFAAAAFSCYTSNRNLGSRCWRQKIFLGTLLIHSLVKWFENNQHKFGAKSVKFCGFGPKPIKIFSRNSNFDAERINDIDNPKNRKDGMKENLPCRVNFLSQRHAEQMLETDARDISLSRIIKGSVCVTL